MHAVHAASGCCAVPPRSMGSKTHCCQHCLMLRAFLRRRAPLLRWSARRRRGLRNPWQVRLRQSLSHRAAASNRSSRTSMVRMVWRPSCRRGSTHRRFGMTWTWRNSWNMDLRSKFFCVFNKFRHYLHKSSSGQRANGAGAWVSGAIACWAAIQKLAQGSEGSHPSILARAVSTARCDSIVLSRHVE